MASKEHVEFSVRVPREEYEALLELAADNERRLAAEIRLAIREYLKARQPA